MASNLVTLLYICAVFGVNASRSGKQHGRNKEFPSLPELPALPALPELPAPNDIIGVVTDPLINLFTKVNPEQVTFYLYTRSNKKSGTLITKDTIKTVKMDKTRKTKIISHGWRGSHEVPSVQALKNTYLEHRDCNVLMVDWSPIADNINYQIPARLVHQVGFIVGQMINEFINNGLKANLIHLLGFSLGAHVVAEAGNHIVEKLPRVTNPAAPLVSNHTKFATAATLVDVIHTGAPLIGIYDRIGTVDFYVNGGLIPQADCSVLDVVMQACSHNYAWVIFAVTIKNGAKFSGRQCKSQFRPLIGEQLCQGKTEIMGDGVSKSASGIYYVKAKGVPIPEEFDAAPIDAEKPTLPIALEKPKLPFKHKKHKEKKHRKKET